MLVFSGFLELVEVFHDHYNYSRYMIDIHDIHDHIESHMILTFPNVYIM